MTADATDQLRGANVLITGGAGFIGSTLAARLVDDNRITIYDNFARDALSTTSLASHPNVHVIRGDILDLEQLSRGDAAAIRTSSTARRSPASTP